MRDRNFVRCAWGSCLAVLLVLSLGCEKAETNASLIVTPSAADVAEVDDQILLTVSLPATGTATGAVATLLFPLEWSVTDPGQGDIIPSGGDSAVYRNNVKDGINVVKVRDQAGREGFATIN